MFVKNFTPFVLGALLLPMLAVAQDTGTANYGGTIPTTYRITNTLNTSLADTTTLGFGTLTVASGTLTQSTPLQFRLRSNAPYVLSAQASVTSGITHGAASAAGTTAQDIKTGDIGFGITAALDTSGGSVVGGRTDTIATGFSVISGWPAVTTGHTPAFTKTLNDLATNTTILNGTRISASGDNSSSDNFIAVSVGLATLPQYLTAATFAGTITFTLGAS